jgi:hypothetical protein
MNSDYLKQQIRMQKLASSTRQSSYPSLPQMAKNLGKDIVKNFPQVNFVGKTNRGNLVFENKNKQLKVSPNGQIL